MYSPRNKFRKQAFITLQPFLRRKGQYPVLLIRFQSQHIGVDYTTWPQTQSCVDATYASYRSSNVISAEEKKQA
jgi:hypothetical protein